MSNRRRLAPPPDVATYAQTFACSDCNGRAGAPLLDPAGAWHIYINHDPGCPVLAGAIDLFPDVVAAAIAATPPGRAAIVGHASTRRPEKPQRPAAGP